MAQLRLALANDPSIRGDKQPALPQARLRQACALRPYTASAALRGRRGWAYTADIAGGGLREGQRCKPIR